MKPCFSGVVVVAIVRNKVGYLNLRVKRLSCARIISIGRIM